jgi:hypothetical protein
MKEIKITRGLVTQVDDEWFDELNQLRIRAKYDGRKYYAVFGVKAIGIHRVITNAPKGMEVDHIDGNTLNNQANNLRVCTHRENGRNRGKASINTSGYKGVFKKRKKWEAQLNYLGKKIHSKTFDTVKEAAIAYDELAKKYHGKFANLNFNE